jgi:hypothetical protein
MGRQLDLGMVSYCDIPALFAIEISADRLLEMSHDMHFFNGQPNRSVPAKVLIRLYCMYGS